jgi:hypothetical protein
MTRRASDGRHREQSLWVSAVDIPSSGARPSRNEAAGQRVGVELSKTLDHGPCGSGRPAGVRLSSGLSVAAKRFAACSRTVTLASGDCVCAETSCLARAADGVGQRSKSNGNRRATDKPARSESAMGDQPQDQSLAFHGQSARSGGAPSGLITSPVGDQQTLQSGEILRILSRARIQAQRSQRHSSRRPGNIRQGSPVLICCPMAAAGPQGGRGGGCR